MEIEVNDIIYDINEMNCISTVRNICIKCKLKTKCKNKLFCMQCLIALKQLVAKLPPNKKKFIVERKRDCISDNNSDVSMTSQISSINSNKTVRIKKICIKCGRNCFSNNFCSGKICLSFRKCLDEIHDSNGACIK